MFKKRIVDALHDSMPFSSRHKEYEFKEEKWLPKYPLLSVSYEEGCHLMLADEDWPGRGGDGEEGMFKLYLTARIPQTHFHLNYFVNSLVVPLLTLFGTSA